MPSNAPGQKIIQVQLDNEKVEKLDMITQRTYVPRSTLIRMAIDRFVDDALNGRIQMGIGLSAGPSAPGSSGPQAAFTVVADPKGGQ